MDRDQQFYPEEELESREEDTPEIQQDSAAAQDGEIDDNGYFMQLLELLRNTIERGKRIPLTGRTIIDSDSCLAILNDLEKNLPETIQFCRNMNKEKDRILSDASETAKRMVASAEMRTRMAKEAAKKQVDQNIADAEAEADAIVAEARERADRMVSESEVVRRANDEARSIRNDARVDADEMRLKANHDAYKLIESAENHLAEACGQLRSIRQQLGEDEN